MVKVKRPWENKKGGVLAPPFVISSKKLVVRGSGGGHDVHAAAVLVELHLAVDERKQRPIAAGADVLARENLLPRWRTMMLPAVTTSPPNSFTPSRLLTLSRPLRTLP